MANANNSDRDFSMADQDDHDHEHDIHNLNLRFRSINMRSSSQDSDQRPPTRHGDPGIPNRHIGFDAPPHILQQSAAIAQHTTHHHHNNNLDPQTLQRLALLLCHPQRPENTPTPPTTTTTTTFHLLRNRRPDLSHTFASDAWDADYSHTNLCRWCGLAGHTAIDCIKWDAAGLDKPVCVACNSKLHLLSTCPRKWPGMSEAERRELLLVRGAGKPGARSEIYPWTRYLDVDGPVPRAYPLTRAFLKELSDSDVGAMYAFWWRDCDYNEPLPERLIDRNFSPVGADETWY